MRKTNIYILDFGNQIKIGQSDNVVKRIKTIENQSGIKAKQVFSIEAEQGYENLAHKVLSEYRGIGEYFSIPFDIAVSILKSIISYNFINFIKAKSDILLPLVNNTNKNEVHGIKTILHEGMTVSEMMKALNLPRKTVEMRLLRRGHKPLSYEAVYSNEAFEDIKKTPGKGRPKKTTEKP